MSSRVRKNGGQFAAQVAITLRRDAARKPVGYLLILMHDGRVGPVSAQHEECLDDILTSSRHLLQLIDDVVADAGKLKQILYNYLSNALKFTPEGGG